MIKRNLLIFLTRRNTTSCSDFQLNQQGMSHIFYAIEPLMTFTICFCCRVDDNLPSDDDDLFVPDLSRVLSPRVRNRRRNQRDNQLQIPSRPINGCATPSASFPSPNSIRTSTPVPSSQPSHPPHISQLLSPREKEYTKWYVDNVELLPSIGYTRAWSRCYIPGGPDNDLRHLIPKLTEPVSERVRTTLLNGRRPYKPSDPVLAKIVAELYGLTWDNDGYGSYTSLR